MCDTYDHHCDVTYCSESGCGLAGGKWDKIEPIVRDELLTHDIPVYVYGGK